MRDDALLLRRAQKGDAQAFETLIAPFERRVYAVCLRMMGSREDALDCAQDAMLRIWRALPGYRGDASLSTWVCRIATNACLDMLRKRKTRPSVSLDGLVEAGYMPPDGPRADPHAQAESAEQRRRVAAAIAQLPEDMRGAIVLRDVQGLSYEEVAQALDTPLGTVKSRINRARARLREALGGAMELTADAPVYTSERRETHDMQ